MNRIDRIKSNQPTNRESLSRIISHRDSSISAPRTCTTCAAAAHPASPHCCKVPPRKRACKNAPVNVSPAPVVSMASTPSARDVAFSPSRFIDTHPRLPLEHVATLTNRNKYSSASFSISSLGLGALRPLLFPTALSLTATSSRASSSLQKMTSIHPDFNASSNASRQFLTTSNDAKSIDTIAPFSFAIAHARRTTSGLYNAYPSMCKTFAFLRTSSGKSSARVCAEAPKYVRIVRCPCSSTKHKHLALPTVFVFAPLFLCQINAGFTPAFRSARSYAIPTSSDPSTPPTNAHASSAAASSSSSTTLHSRIFAIHLSTFAADPPGVTRVRRSSPLSPSIASRIRSNRRASTGTHPPISTAVAPPPPVASASASLSSSSRRRVMISRRLARWRISVTGSPRPMIIVRGTLRHHARRGVTR